MNIKVELSPKEVKEAIKNYLKSEFTVDDESTIDFVTNNYGLIKVTAGVKSKQPYLYTGGGKD